MKRLIQTYALALALGAAGAQAAAQTTTAGVADPQAAVPATAARPAIDYRTESAPAARPDRTWRDANATVAGRDAMRLTMPAMSAHDHHAGMDMGAQQCTTGGCGSMKDAHGDHGTAMPGMQWMAGGGDQPGCCAGMHGDGHAAHGDGMKAMQGMQGKQGGTCGCCAGMKTNDGGGCCHKEGT